MTKTSGEIAIEIRDTEKAYNKAVEESKRAIEMEERRLKTAIERNAQFKYKIVKRLGKMLERSGLVKLDRISTRITNDFRGYIARLTVQQACEPRWKRAYRTPPDHGRHTRKLRDETSSTESKLSEPLTPTEEQFLQSFEDGHKRDKKVDEMVELLTNKSFAELYRIRASADQNKEDWRKALLNASKDYMTTTAAQMNDTDVNGTLNDMRTLEVLADGYGDILYTERERRLKHKETGIGEV